jgi:hypothetical protein
MTPKPKTSVIDWTFFPPLLPKAQKLAGQPPNGAMQKRLMAELLNVSGLHLRDPRKLRMMAVTMTEALYLLQEMPAARCITRPLGLTPLDQGLLLALLLESWARWYLLFSTLVPRGVLNGGPMTQTVTLAPINAADFRWHQLEPTPAQAAFGRDWLDGKLEGATAGDVRRFMQRLTSRRAGKKWDDPLYNYCLGTSAQLLISSFRAGSSDMVAPAKIDGYESIAAVCWQAQLLLRHR